MRFFTQKQKTKKQINKSSLKKRSLDWKLTSKKALQEKKAIKWTLVYHCKLSIPDKYRDHPLTVSPHFRTLHALTTTYTQQLREQLDGSLENVEDEMSLFAQSGSDWILEQNYALILEIVDYLPLGGSSYIELPKEIHDSKAVVNMKNEDQECFKWSILATLHPQRTNPQRVFKCQAYNEERNFEGIEFPVPIHQISKFEKQNPGISVSVLGIAAEKTKKRKGKSQKELSNTTKSLRRATRKTCGSLVLVAEGTI